MLRHILLATSVAAVALALLAACQQTEEEVSLSTATPTPTPLSETPSATPTATVAPTPTAPPVPADWATYMEPGGLFSVRYPPTWFQRDGTLYSDNPDMWDRPSQPSEVLTLHIGYYLDGGPSGCGILSVDPATGEVSPEKGATAVSLGGVPAWQIVREPGDPLLNDPFTRIQFISVIYKGYCFSFASYFTQQNPDVATFLQIASSFEFKF